MRALPLAGADALQPEFCRKAYANTELLRQACLQSAKSAPLDCPGPGSRWQRDFAPVFILSDAPKSRFFVASLSE